MSRSAKPTRGVTALLKRMGSKPLHKVKDEKGRWIYTLLNDQRAQRSDVVERAIKDGHIVPGNDALFASDQSQTWRKA